MSCSEEDLPVGVYDYQVERLLTGQTGSKNWEQVIGSTDCADSVRLHFELVEDSIDISRFTFNASCVMSDPDFIGRANASSFSGSDLFTDSLNFSDGTFWIIRRVTSELLRVQVEEESLDYRSSN